MAEKYYSISPYVYCANNPLRFIDPDGKQIRAVVSVGRIRRMYNAYKVAKAVEGVGFWSAIGAAISSNQMLSPDQAEQAKNSLIQDMENFNSNVEVSNSTQELNKGHLPDPG